MFNINKPYQEDRRAYIHITCRDGEVTSKIKGNSGIIVMLASRTLARTLFDAKKACVTNEELADAVRKTMLEELNDLQEAADD